MTPRHVLDESGLWADELDEDALVEVIDDFIIRLETARERGEPVARSHAIFDARVTSELDLLAFLFERSRSPINDPDLLRRLSRVIDQAPIWEDDDELVELLEALEVHLEGERVAAPSLALAHALRKRPHTVGCLNFRSSGRSAKTAVEVGGISHELHFVVDEPSHRLLFRDAIELEDMNEAAFAANADSAFPELVWADELWSGLGDFQRPYREQRTKLTHHLTVLNDVGAQLFEESINPAEISPRLDALGVRASSENGRTKRDKKARADRTRMLEGVETIFWWHTKLLPNIDRVHFLWRPARDEDPSDIVIGLFTDHCHLP